MAEASCGHASCWMEVDSEPNSPQVHLHFLTENDEYLMTGYWKIELCCHGCARSVLVYYYTPRGKEADEHVRIRSDFLEQHRSCPNRNYEAVCSDYRSGIELLDLRERQLTQRRCRRTS